VGLCSLLRMKKPVPENPGLMYSNGDIVPANGTSGYAIGCIFVCLASGDINGQYLNKGVVGSCLFEKIGGGSLITTKLRVYFDGTQNFAIGTPKKVTFNNINYDVNSEWDATNNRFIAKEAGYYQISGKLQWANYKSKVGSMMFYRNYVPGSSPPIGEALLIVLGSDNYTGAEVTGITINYLNVGDFVEMWGLASNAVSYGGSSTMFFSIIRVP